MIKQEAIIIASDFFKSYPLVNAFFITTDEQVFEEATMADAHAAFLDKKNPVVIKLERGELEAAKVEKLVVSAEQAQVTKLAAVVAGLQKQFAKAGAAKKAGIQTKLDEANAALDTANNELAIQLAEQGKGGDQE